MTPGSRWPEARLATVCTIVSGATPSRAVEQYWGGGILWATPRDLSALDQPILETTAEKITEAGHRSCSATLMPAGSVLFSSRAPIGLVAIAGNPMCTNQGFKSLAPGPTVDSRYLYWCMVRMAPRIADMGTGATFKEVSKAVMERVSIPLPPLVEQKRIAAILDRADTIWRGRRQVMALADGLVGSALFELFGDPMHNVRRYPVWELRDLVRAGDKINYGIVQPGPEVAAGVPIVRVGDFDNLEINAGALKRVGSQVEAAYPRSRLVGDEVLISCVGSIGEVALADERLAGMNIVRAVARVRCSDKLDRAYLASYLRTPFAQAYFCRETRTVSQPTLNIRQIELTPVIVPPIEEQARFGALFSATRRLCLRCKTSESVSGDLSRSLSDRAFRGEL